MPYSLRFFPSRFAQPAWDLGNFNYDAAINMADAAILQKNFNASIPASPAVPSFSAVPVTQVAPQGPTPPVTAIPVARHAPVTSPASQPPQTDSKDPEDKQHGSKPNRRKR